MSNTLQLLSNHCRNRYLLMRHGHSQANQQGIIVSSPERGIEGFGLSEYGEQQLAELVADWQWEVPTRVVHSDFLRTTQTAARVAAKFGLAPSEDKRLRERNFGDREGLEDKHYPGIWALDADDADHQHDGVEAVSAVAQRMHAVIVDWEHFSALQVDQLIAIELDRARRRFDQAIDTSQHGAFARTRCAYDRNNAVTLYLEVKPFQHGFIVAITFDQIGNFQHVSASIVETMTAPPAAVRYVYFSKFSGV